MHIGAHGEDQEASQAAETPLKRLEFLLQHHVALVQENSGIPRLLFSGEVFCGSEGKRERLFRLINGYLARVAEIIREGQRAGDIRNDMETVNISLGAAGRLVTFLLALPPLVWGHCDTLEGPVVVDAKAALAKALAVRSKGKEA